ncbi:MAG: hypothetical protein Q8L27_04895 [archaeon]|nr:hypothetical protein [archaeon]
MDAEDKKNREFEFLASSNILLKMQVRVAGGSWVAGCAQTRWRFRLC